jgi:hypothetical protein
MEARLFVRESDNLFMQIHPSMGLVNEDRPYPSVQSAREAFQEYDWDMVESAFIVTDREVIWLDKEMTSKKAFRRHGDAPRNPGGH